MFGRSLLSEPKMAGLREAIKSVEGIPGDVAELGVFQGGSARILATACPCRTVHLFDTFTGLPWDGFDADTDRHSPGEFAASLSEVREYLSDCSNVRFHPGLFPGTAVDGAFALVHIDADLYASTLAGLTWFWPRMLSGSLCVLDDYGWAKCPGVERAVEEYFSARTDATMTETTQHQLLVKKTPRR